MSNLRLIQRIHPHYRKRGVSRYIAEILSCVSADKLLLLLLVVVVVVVVLVVVVHTWARSGAVVEALRYKPEGRGIDSRWCNWNFLLT
jgi:cell division protein FtsL